MAIDIEPKLLSPGDIDALIREAEALPDINKGLWTHNERELIGFCQRLAEALAGEHLLRRPDITGADPRFSGGYPKEPPHDDRAGQPNLFPDAPPHHGCMQRLIRRADAAIVNLRDREDDWDFDCVALISAIEELRDALKRELRIRRSKAAPQNPHAGAAVSEMSPLTLKIFDLLANYSLTETRYDEGGAYPLIDALTLTDETVAQGYREAAALAGALGGEITGWLNADHGRNLGKVIAPDMFWDASDPELCKSSPEEIIVDGYGYGEVVEIQNAAKLPNTFVAMLEGDGNGGRDDWSFEGESFDEARAAVLSEIHRRAAQGGA